MMLAIGSSLLGVACLDVAPTPAPRFLPFERPWDFDGGRFARPTRRTLATVSPDEIASRNFAGASPRTVGVTAAGTPPAPAGLASPSPGVASALIHKTSEAAITEKMSTY